MAPFGAARTGMDWEGACGLKCDDVLCVHRVWVIQVSMFSWSVMTCSVFTGFGLYR